MPRLNVRCCCQPQKVFGTLDVPTWERDQKYKGVAISLRDFSQWSIDGKYSSELAVYSDDRPVEFWRQFETFQEAEPCETDF